MIFGRVARMAMLEALWFPGAKQVRRGVFPSFEEGAFASLTSAPLQRGGNRLGRPPDVSRTPGFPSLSMVPECLLNKCLQLFAVTLHIMFLALNVCCRHWSGSRRWQRNELRTNSPSDVHKGHVDVAARSFNIDLADHDRLFHHHGLLRHGHPLTSHARDAIGIQ